MVLDLNMSNHITDLDMSGFVGVSSQATHLAGGFVCKACDHGPCPALFSFVTRG